MRRGWGLPVCLWLGAAAAQETRELEGGVARSPARRSSRHRRARVLRLAGRERVGGPEAPELAGGWGLTLAGDYSALAGSVFLMGDAAFTREPDVTKEGKRSLHYSYSVAGERAGIAVQVEDRSAMLKHRGAFLARPSGVHFRWRPLPNSPGIPVHLGHGSAVKFMGGRSPGRNCDHARTRATTRAL